MINDINSQCLARHKFNAILGYLLEVTQGAYIIVFERYLTGDRSHLTVSLMGDETQERHVFLNVSPNAVRNLKVHQDGVSFDYWQKQAPHNIYLKWHEIHGLVGDSDKYIHVLNIQLVNEYSRDFDPSSLLLMLNRYETLPVKPETPPVRERPTLKIVK